ncbi:DUF1376 domain-containing protein, partial [Luteitalea sp.]
MASSSLPWFPFFAKEWLTSTLGMSAEARGSYINLLAYAWDNDGLPVDEESCRGIAGVDRAPWKRVWPVLAVKWPVVDGRRRNERLEEARAGAQKMLSGASKAGQASSAARRDKHGTAQPPNGRSNGRSNAPSNDGSNGTPNGDRNRSPNDDPNAARTIHNHRTDPSTTTDRDLRDSSGPPPAVASSSSVTSSRPAPRGGGQLAALGLVEAWNRLGPGLKVDTAVLGPDAWRRLRDAMRRRDLAAWETIFDTCATSDYLAGREDLPALDLWTVIEKLADRIAAGKYRTHPAPAAVARPTALPGAEDFA